MSLNCSCSLLQVNMEFIDEQRSADMLDALADLAYEQEQAMRETEQNEWDGVYIEDEISSAERNACDHYNERYVYPVINS
jgi:nucleosome binding factor SPN SPT16 subunit